MNKQINTGMSFGLTSGVITTLGLMVGLHAGTHSPLAVIGGVVTVAIADALSDALGIHVAEESRGDQTTGQIWQATFATFLAKFFMALSFVIPLLLFELTLAVVISVGWGMAVLSYRMARAQGAAPWKVMGEHLLIAALVVAATQLVGVWVAATFQDGD